MITTVMIRHHDSSNESTLWLKLEGYRDLLRDNRVPYANMSTRIIEHAKEINSGITISSFKVNYFEKIFFKTPTGTWSLDEGDYLFAIQPLRSYDDLGCQALGIISEYLFTPNADFVVALGSSSTSLLYGFSASYPEKLIEEIIRYGNTFF